MLKSLRFRLPALFLAGIALSGLVTSLIALRLFQDYTRTTTLNELRQEASGLAQLYAESAVRAVDEEKAAPAFAAAKLEAATGDRLFYVGESLSPGEDSGLTRISVADVGVDLSRDRIVTFEFEPPGQDRPYLAAAYPIRPGGAGATVFGYLIVAKPNAELRETWLTLLSRLAIAFLAGLVVVGALAFYLSRRITGPVLALSDAADRVAEGHYDVEVPHVPGGGEIGHLANRFREMARAARGGRGARAQLPHVRLPRAAHAADRDPRPRRRAAGRRRHRSRGGGGVARDRRRRGGAARPARQRRPRPGEARRAPVHRPHRGGRHEPALRPCLLDVLRGSPPARDRVHAGRRRGAGDRLGRRPRAADHLEPALERLSLDARRRPHRARALEQRTGRSRSTSPTRARASARRSGSESSGRSGRPTAAAPGSGCRSRESSRSRSAAGSSCRRRPGRAAASGSCCRFLEPR